MKFSSQEEIDAPVGQVFEQLSDVDGFEASMRKRGAAIARSPSQGLGVGTTWDARVDFRGKKRAVTMVLKEFTQDEHMLFEGGSSGIDLTVTVDTTALTPRTTRVKLQVEAKPKTLGARLLVQSAKLAKGRLDTRFKSRFADYAKNLGKQA